VREQDELRMAKRSSLGGVLEKIKRTSEVREEDVVKRGE